MFAEVATIAGWSFNNNYFYSNSKCVCFNGSDTSVGGSYSDQVPFLAAGNGDGATGAVYNSSTKQYEINKNANLRLYPTGIIRLGNSGVEVCGIAGTGSSDSDVRFWAGHSDRVQAPFRVTQGGSVYASNAYVRGEINCKKLTVSDYSAYGGPGVVCICHYNGHNFWNKYSVNGKKVSGVSITGTGYFTITHNIGNLNYIAYVIGNTFRGYIDGTNQGSDTGSFIGSSRCTEISTNSCKMHIKNTDNKDDSPDYSKAIDIIFLSY